MPNAASSPVALAGIDFGRLARSAAVCLAVAWLGILAIVYPLQRKLLFVTSAERVTPVEAGLSEAAEVMLETRDGERLVAWWAQPAPGKAVVLYFQGNSGIAAHRAERFRILTEAGFGILAPAYRGYGGSTGSPTEAALVADAGVAYDWLLAKGLSPARIVLIGESLGSGVSVQLAAARPVAGLILDSPFSSVTDVAARRFPYLPVHYLLRDRFDSMAHIGRVRARLLVVHGDRDGIVPYDLGQRLFAAAREPKRMLTLRGAGHTAPFMAGAWSAIRPFLEDLPQASAASR
jgi:hypothetical protein